MMQNNLCVKPKKMLIEIHSIILMFVYFDLILNKKI